MSGTALPTAGRFRFVASDRTGRPWITLFVLRGVHQTGSGSLGYLTPAQFERRWHEGSYQMIRDLSR